MPVCAPDRSEIRGHVENIPVRKKKKQNQNQKELSFSFSKKSTGGENNAKFYVHSQARYFM